MDKDQESSRRVPMEFLCLGLCRTGTQSLADSLEMLGYGTIYHMREVHKHQHAQFWMEALRAYHGDAGFKTKTRAEYDRVLGEFGGVSDIPSVIVGLELIDVYPEARIILSVRDDDAWVRSMKNTIIHNKGPELEAVKDSQTPYRKELREAVQRNWGKHADFDHNGPNIFHKHNQAVRDAAAKRGRDILELDITQPGAFQKLCAWLEKELPGGLTEFPKRDDWSTFKVKHTPNGT